MRAGGGLGEIDLDRGLRIGAGLGAGRTGKTAAEQRAEQVVQEPHVHEALGVEALARDPFVPVAVVARAAILVREHLVGLGHVAEARLGVRRLGDVGMQLAGEPAKRLLDLAVARVAADAEELVVVLLRHRVRDSTFWNNSNPILQGYLECLAIDHAGVRGVHDWGQTPIIHGIAFGCPTRLPACTIGV